MPLCRLAFAEQRLRFLAGLQHAGASSGKQAPEAPRSCTLLLLGPGRDSPALSLPGGAAAVASPGLRRGTPLVNGGTASGLTEAEGVPTPVEAALRTEVEQLARERLLLLRRMEVRLGQCKLLVAKCSEQWKSWKGHFAEHNGMLCLANCELVLLFNMLGFP